MDDSISRQAAIEIVRTRCARIPTMAIRAMQEIKDLPSIQPKRGKYKAVVCDGVDLLACSECGYTGAFWSYNFCPNCGAQMVKGGTNENN